MSFTYRRRPIGGEIIPSDDDNVDLWLRLDGGRVFTATFFTVKNISTLMNRWRESGENAGGTYCWATDRVIVETISEDVIERTIADLISRDQIGLCLEQLEPRFDDIGVV